MESVNAALSGCLRSQRERLSSKVLEKERSLFERLPEEL